MEKADIKLGDFWKALKANAALLLNLTLLGAVCGGVASLLIPREWRFQQTLQIPMYVGVQGEEVVEYVRAKYLLSEHGPDARLDTVELRTVPGIERVVLTVKGNKKEAVEAEIGKIGADLKNTFTPLFEDHLQQIRKTVASLDQEREANLAYTAAAKTNPVAGNNFQIVEKHLKAWEASRQVRIIDERTTLLKDVLHRNEVYGFGLSQEKPAYLGITVIPQARSAVLGAVLGLLLAISFLLLKNTSLVSLRAARAEA